MTKQVSPQPPEALYRSNTRVMVSNLTRSVKCFLFYVFVLYVGQWFPTSGRDPNQSRGGSDIASREGFMENSIIMGEKKSKFVSKFICQVHYKFIQF
jgi:hypothetical protein